YEDRIDLLAKGIVGRLDRLQPPNLRLVLDGVDDPVALVEVDFRQPTYMLDQPAIFPIMHRALGVWTLDDDLLPAAENLQHMPFHLLSFFLHPFYIFEDDAEFGDRRRVVLVPVDEYLACRAMAPADNRGRAKDGVKYTAEEGGDPLAVGVEVRCDVSGRVE